MKRSLEWSMDRLARRAPFWLRAAILAGSAVLIEAEPTGRSFRERISEPAWEATEPVDLLSAWIAAEEPREDRDLFRKALRAWGERRPGSMGTLLEAAQGASPATRADLISACGEVGDARTVPALLGALEQDAALSEHALAQLARCGPLLPAGWTERAGSRLAPWAGHSEESMATRALDALAALGCVDQVQTFAELLNDPREKVREAALRGLRKLTGRDAAGEPGPWQAWIAQEREFSRGALGGQLEDLRLAPVSELADRVRALDGHGLLRNEIAAGVARLLERPEQPVRELACRRLGASGSALALAPLLRALKDEGLQEAAGEALQALTGRVEADWEAWAAACEAAR